MKIHPSALLLVPALIGCASVLLPITWTHAEQIVNQTIHNTDSNDLTTGELDSIQYIGNGYSGRLINPIGIYIRAGVVGATARFRLHEGTTQNFGTVTNSWDLGVFRPSDTSEVLVHASSTATINFDPTKYYGVTVYCNSGCQNDIYVRGSASNVFVGGSYFNDNGANVADIYLSMFNDVIDSTSRIISLNAPANNGTTATEVVTFEYTYFNNPSDGFVKTGVTLVDLTASQSIVGASTTISGSGQFNASLQRQLASGHQYRWTAYLEKANGQRVISQSQIFYVVSFVGYGSSTASVLQPSEITESNASSTLQSTLMQFLNIFSLVQNKIPFAYVDRVIEEIDTSNLPATSEFAAVRVDFPTSTNSMLNIGTVELFSTSTVTDLMGNTIHSALYLLAEVALYMGTILAMWNGRNQFFS